MIFKNKKLTAGTTAALTINTVNGSVAGIEGVTNLAAITGGTDVGTIQERLALVKQNFKGRNLATTAGIKIYVDNYSKQSSIIGSDSPLMLRTDNLGGGIDIYITIYALLLDGGTIGINTQYCLEDKDLADKYFSIVLAFAGDSAMTRFLLI